MALATSEDYANVCALIQCYHRANREGFAMVADDCDTMACLWIMCSWWLEAIKGSPVDDTDAHLQRMSEDVLTWS
jgi:hypothetical protein